MSLNVYDVCVNLSSVYAKHCPTCLIGILSSISYSDKTAYSLPCILLSVNLYSVPLAFHHHEQPSLGCQMNNNSFCDTDSIAKCNHHHHHINHKTSRNLITEPADYQPISDFLSCT